MIWENLKKDLILTDLDAKTPDDVFDKMGGLLTEKGYTKATYVQALKDRERDYPTGLNIEGIGVAIPHTPVEHVNKAATCIAVLKNPVTFIEMGMDDEVPVKLVFMLAVVDPNAHIDDLTQIVAIIQDKNVMDALTSSQNTEEMIDIIRQKENDLAAEKASA
ncbi:PTS sugar transporter subunit IIA [Pseudoramibacter faecis]|uniref:PTS sugar transporter subunit IIA n=1 Tax=Pseudoramibacter faecis TaxID=3108534 RepID=UPI002E770B2F|nr:PTS sugar transporter subunit IIA [Pseudoramibacter sp. HA2172]